MNNTGGKASPNIAEDISVIGIRCTGCGACVIACTNNCITMTPDAEGFYYPQIQKQDCISCGKCLRVCPSFSAVPKKKPEIAYAATSKNGKETEKSASGGMFYYAAKFMIERMHGYVCGAVLDDHLGLRHILTNDMSMVSKMQGSKYIQSSVYDCYTGIRELVSSGVNVLFCGTPCQVAGVLKTIGNSECLYTMDVVCHGVPSNLAFAEYVKSMYGTDGFPNLSFRQKNPHIKSIFAYAFDKNSGKRKTIPAFQDPFYQAFLDGANYRECCYTCQYANPERVGNITIGDCANWRAYDLPVDAVLSTLTVNTAKGKRIWNAIADNLQYTQADYDKESRLNKQLSKPTARSSKRDSFYQDINKLSWKQLKDKYCHHRSPKEKIHNFILMHTSARSRYRLCHFLRKMK